MWNQMVLVVLVVSVPAQYLISKYWTTKGTTYYLQKTFSSLDEKLQLREWSTWPDKWVRCAKRFIFDYRGMAADSEEGDGGEEDEGLWDEFDMHEPRGDAKPLDEEKKRHAQKNAKSVVKKNEDGYDPDVHFGTSKEPRSPRHPSVVYHVGQVVRSKKRGYRGVIVGWDPRPVVPDKLKDMILPKDQPELAEHPWYAVLIDTRDRIVPQMDYVPERDIELLFNAVIVQPVLHEYFELGPLVDSRYRMRPYVRFVYPED